MEIATRRREQEVWQACDDLWALHGEMGGLTGDCIRDHLIHLGKSRGSPNEIYKYRKTWIISRGLSGRSDHLVDEGEADPISRAVKLVHEQLKNEAHEQIAVLKEEFERDLKLKDEELIRAKNALDAVMVEFGELQRALDESRMALNALSEERDAEIEVRKASERELLHIKELHGQERASHATLINEIKSLHEQERLHLDNREKERELAQKVHMDKLLEEKKQLGFEYSEKLNELKTIIYNQDLLTKQLEKKLTESQAEIHRMLVHVESKNKQIEHFSRENAQISSALSASVTELHILRNEKKSRTMELKLLTVAHKKSQLTIARLRASRASVS